LIASELFGHERGAFTGAQERRPGRFEEGDGGTIFLDEISTIDDRVQISLLRLIEHRSFNRLGGHKLLRTNVRIVAATNQRLRELVEQGTFREDLYYRLDVFRIETPPLRARYGDIPLLVEAFIRRYNRVFNKKIQGPSPETAALLERYPWPGNVRELKNVIQRAVLSCTSSKLMAEHLPSRLRNETIAPVTIPYAIGTPLQDFEREAITRTLTLALTRKEAAQMLGISRRALYNKLRKYGIE
jgi:transcriptional regulator with PAS, ATPase and Fis domain